MYNTITQATWKQALKEEFNQPYMKELEAFLHQEEALGKNLYPQKPLWFNALNSTPLNKVKVLILGQDPYPTVGHAHGLCFSALDPIKPLQNIYKELNLT